MSESRIRLIDDSTHVMDCILGVARCNQDLLYPVEVRRPVRDQGNIGDAWSHSGQHVEAFDYDDLLKASPDPATLFRRKRR